MLYLAFILHMHQPYYKNLLTNEAEVPWVRLHGVKDYLDMVQILDKYPAIHQTFNLVPSLLEQLDDYINNTVKDKFLELSYKPAGQLTPQDKAFISEKFFYISKERVISLFPRYYELYLRKQAKKEFSEEDYRDLQVLFNLAWIDPSFRQDLPQLKNLTGKARFFSEEDKRVVLETQIGILKQVVSGYKKAAARGQIELITNPFYHPILPLLCSTKIAKEANPKTVLPKTEFSWPQDAVFQIEEAIRYHKDKFGSSPAGMWPSEESVSEHIVPFLIDAGINWIVADEAILFKSLKIKKRDTRLLYQPHLLKRKNGALNIIFRDRNISDMIGFTYYSWKAEDAADNFIFHLQNTANAFKGQDILLTIAMDGENAWEYFPNDGHDFLNALYKKISEADFLKTVTISEYLNMRPAREKINRLAAGSWIYAEFGKWIGNPHKVRAWEWLVEARKALENSRKRVPQEQLALALKQMYILEGSDWFWWYGEDPNGDFDRLYRMHLTNLYSLIGKDHPGYLKKPLAP